MLYQIVSIEITALLAIWTCLATIIFFRLEATKVDTYVHHKYCFTDKENFITECIEGF